MTTPDPEVPGELLDPAEGLEPPQMGMLDEPTIVDAADAATIRGSAAVETEDRDAATQQGRVAGDVILAKSRGGRRARREAETDDRIDEKLRRIFASERDGYLEIERLSPRDAPDMELGVIPQALRWTEVEGASVNEVIAKKHGGGDYRLVPRRADHTAVDADIVIVKISGAPKFRTNAGRTWWNAVEKSGTTENPVEALKQAGGEASMFQFVIGFLERDKEAQRLAHEADVARRKEEAEERKREWEERQKEREAKNARDLAELTARMEKELARDKARAAEDAQLAKSRMDFALEQMKQDAEDRRARAERQEEEDREERKARREAQARREEAKETGGLGFAGVKRIREQLAEVVGKDLLKSAGLDEDEEEGGIKGAFAEVIREQGPELLKSAANIFLPKLANLLPGGNQPAPAAAPAPAPRVLPPPPAEPADVGPGPVRDMVRSVEAVRAAAAGESPPADDNSGDGTTPPDAAAAPASATVEAPTLQAAAQMAAGYSITTVLQFFRPIAPLMLAQPEADAAWDQPVCDGGKTIDEAYRAMPKGARDAAATNWDSFVDAVKSASPGDAQLYADALKQDGAADWIKEFLAVGPWVPEEDDDDES